LIFRDNYNRSGIDYLLYHYKSFFYSAAIHLQIALREFCERHRFGDILICGRKWTEDLKKFIHEYSSETVQRKFPVIIPLCKNAVKVNQDLLDIQRLELKFYSYNRALFNEDEKQKLIEEAARLIKVIGGIAAYLNIPNYTEIIQSSIYDINKENLQKRNDGSYFFVHKGNLTEAQLKLTPLAYSFVHPPPKQ
jgi:hypothetical protein